MASLLNADLPSEDEMDEDFDPDAEDAGKPAKKAKPAAGGVSRCAGHSVRRPTASTISTTT